MKVHNELITLSSPSLDPHKMNFYPENCLCDEQDTQQKTECEVLVRQNDKNEIGQNAHNNHSRELFTQIIQMSSVISWHSPTSCSAYTNQCRKELILSLRNIHHQLVWSNNFTNSSWSSIEIKKKQTLLLTCIAIKTAGRSRGRTQGCRP